MKIKSFRTALPEDQILLLWSKHPLNFFAVPSVGLFLTIFYGLYFCQYFTWVILFIKAWTGNLQIWIQMTYQCATMPPYFLKSLFFAICQSMGVRESRWYRGERGSENLSNHINLKIPQITQISYKQTLIPSSKESKMSLCLSEKWGS